VKIIDQLFLIMQPLFLIENEITLGYLKSQLLMKFSMEVLHDHVMAAMLDSS
jgi:hypothetical protein